MSYQLPPLPWLRSFEAAARHLSFTAAAKELNLTPAAVSYQVRSLEGHLDYQLFERLPRSLKLTDLGQAYLPNVRKAFAELSASTIGIFGVKGELSLTVRTTVTFGVLWLAPRIVDFIKRRNNIDVRLVTSNWGDDKNQEEADIEIRYGDGRWGIGEIKLTEHEKVVPLCAPEIAGQIKRPEDLVRFPQIDIMGVEDSWHQILQRAGIATESVSKIIRVDNSMTAMEMCSSGLGISLVFKSLAENYLNSGRLACPLGLEFPSTQSQYIILPKGQTNIRPEIQLFLDWILEEARAQ